MQRRLPMLLNGQDNPRKLPIPLGDLHSHVKCGSVGPPVSLFKTASRSVQPFFAQRTVECPITRFPLPHKTPLPEGDRVSHLTHDIWAHPSHQPKRHLDWSAVFVWVPIAMLYSALSVGKKTSKLPLHLGMSSPRQRRTEP